MRSRRIAVWSAALAGLAILSLGGSAVAGPRVTAHDSTGKYKTKPTTLKFAYPALAPPFKITRLHHWAGWNGTRFESLFPTKARGWLHYDDCTPNCAEGHYRRRRAEVTLTPAQTCHGRLVFRKVKIDPVGLPAHRHRIACSGLLRN